MNGSKPTLLAAILGALLTLVTLGGAGLLSYGNLESKVQQNTDAIAKEDQRSGQVWQTVSQIKDDLARIQEDMVWLKENEQKETSKS